MIKVGFFLSPTLEWIGGINYFRNLFAAINEVNDASVQIILFLPKKIDARIVDMLIPSGQSIKVIRTSLLQRHTPYWLLWKIIRRVFGTDLVALPLCKLNRISIVSHSDFLKTPGIKVINWIPDFQHVNLPEMFSSEEILARSSYYSRLASCANKVVVSSENSLDDLIKFFPKAREKAFILRFVSTLPDNYWKYGDEDRELISSRYKIKGNFFYVPNQFWKHKNHLILVDTLVALRARGMDIKIICSGDQRDYRNPNFFRDFTDYVENKNCTDSLKILGVLPRCDVFRFIKFSLAVINPSYFEGWSTVVEECKSGGKKIILSDIKVHREQAPEAYFINLNDISTLENYLEKIWKDGYREEITEITEINKANAIRIQKFGKEYCELVHELMAD